MTAIAFPFGISSPIRSSPERAVGTDAQRLEESIEEALRFDQSVTIDSRRRTAVAALDAAYALPQNDERDDGAPIIADPAIYPYAKAFLEALPISTPLPEVLVDIDGEIAFEWDYGSRRVLSVSIGRDGTLTYAGLFGAERVHGTAPLGESIPMAIALSIRRVTHASGQLAR